MVRQRTQKKGNVISGVFHTAFTNVYQGILFLLQWNNMFLKKIFLERSHISIFLHIERVIDSIML